MVSSPPEAAPGSSPISPFNWPIMMPAQGVTLADSYDWMRVHRLDQLNGKKPAKLLVYKALTLIKGASRFGPVFFSFAFFTLNS